MSLDYNLRSTWSGVNESVFGQRFERYMDSGALGTHCPKVGIGFFNYKGLSQPLRGAVARADIAKGERFCEMPVQSLLSEFSVGNSTMKPVMDALDAEASAPSNAGGGVLGGRKRNKARALDRRAHIVLLVLRESGRPSSPIMPYASLLLSHDVSGVPMLWEPGSTRHQRASAHLKSMGGATRAQVLRHFDTLVPLAIARFPHLLSEGQGCLATAITPTPTADNPHAQPSCTQKELDALYSREQFLRVFAILSARDWVLPMYGRPRAFCVPIVDMFNFGQVGIRAQFDEKANAFVATASWPIKAGTELLFYYGSLCRESWINMYGFAPAEAAKCPPARPSLAPKAKGKAGSKHEGKGVGR